MAISLIESIQVGLADIKLRKLRTAVTVTGIILGVMSIMVVLSIVNGMNTATLAWMQERGGLTRIVISRNWMYDQRKGGQDYFTLNEIRFIHNMIPEALAFNPVIQEWGMGVKSGDLTYSTDVLGVMPDMVIVEEWEMQSGRFIANLDVDWNNNVIVLGSTAAKELFGTRDPIGEYVSIGDQQFMVTGVLGERFIRRRGAGKAIAGENALEYMNRRVFIPISTMIHKVSPQQQINRIEVKAVSTESAQELRQKLENIILNMRQGRSIFIVTSAKEQLDTMRQNSLIFTAIFVLIAVVSLFVGGIVIMNIMLASVKERTREIGVRIAIGARRWDIFVQFVIQTILITLSGGVLGIILGFSVLDLVSSYLDVTVIATAGMIWTAIMVSAGVGLLFGIAPALRAANLDPVKALREE